MRRTKVNFVLIVKGIDVTIQDLEKAQEKLLATQRRTREASPLSVDALKLHIASNVKALETLKSERIDLDFNLSLLQNALRDGKDKAVVLYFLKTTNDLTTPDDKAKADRNKQKMDELFDYCLESAKAKLKLHEQKIMHYQHQIDEYRTLELKLDECLIEEDLIRRQIDSLAKQLDDYKQRKHKIDLIRDVPLVQFEVIAPPAPAKE